MGYFNHFMFEIRIVKMQGAKNLSVAANFPFFGYVCGSVRGTLGCNAQIVERRLTRRRSIGE